MSDGKDNAENINIDEMDKVVGGQGSSASEEQQKIDEFEAAWIKLGLDEKPISGQMKAGYYQEWKINGFNPSAESFLKTCFNII